MGEPFLEVRNLTKRFGGLTAVDDLSFTIEKGEMVGLVGPNGAGKTTVARLIMGIMKPTSGTVKFKGEDITGKDPAYIVNKGMAITSQIVKPFRHLPTYANVLVSVLSPRARKHGEWVKQAENRAMEALEFCGIRDLANEPANVLSHGDLKRLELAKAIGSEPELILLDEPFGGLNPAETSLIIKSLKRLHQGGRFGRLHREGPTMVLVEHKLSDLMQMVNRVIVISYGKLIADGTPEEVTTNPEVIKIYIGKEVVKLVSGS
jgi:branched-chain amino acid transport system ATP-binding protein